MTIADLITDDIWPIVQQHSWKYGARSRPIDAIVWHATRGGQGYDGLVEYGATLNWFRSPNNRHVDGSNVYAGMSNLVIGPGKVCLAVPLDRMPRFSTWASDEHAVSIEVAQSNLGQDIEAATIATCRAVAARLRADYGIPHTRAYPATGPDDWQWTGEAGHEDTWQGREQGKTDPGDVFWTAYWQGGTAEMWTMAERIMVAAGSGPNVIANYNALVQAGIIVGTDNDPLIPPDVLDLNGYLVRRFKLLEVAASDQCIAAATVLNEGVAP